MDDDGMKLCLICGVDSNKKQKHERYNYLAPMKKKGKKYEESDSGSDSDDSLVNSKSKKKTPQRSSARASTGSRQTRNQNPKLFAASLCKIMDLPADSGHPFLQIFTRADYCTECMPRVKDAHNNQIELEKIQARIHEAKVDFEIDLSKHLAAIPIRTNTTRNNGFERYKEDIKKVLDFTGSEKKAKAKLIKEDEEDEEEAVVVPKRARRQAAINSTLKMKRKLEENGSEDNDEEQEEVVKVNKKTKKTKSDAADEKEFLPEESTSSEPEKDEEEVEEPDGTDSSVVVEEKDDEVSSVTKADNGSADDIKEEEKPVEIVREKKDPNLKCPHCPIPRYFGSSETVQEHIKKSHSHACDLCEKTFKFEGELKKHKSNVHVQRAADDKSSYICGFCDQEFQLKKYLEDHLDQHPEAKPLNCQYCGRGFARKESLQKAFQIYKGEAVEACGRCGKNMNLKDYLEHNKKLKG